MSKTAPSRKKLPPEIIEAIKNLKAGGNTEKQIIEAVKLKYGRTVCPATVYRLTARQKNHTRKSGKKSRGGVA